MASSGRVGSVSLFGSIVALVLMVVLASIPRREHLTLSGPGGRKPRKSQGAEADRKELNRFLVATKLWRIISLRVPEPPGAADAAAQSAAAAEAEAARLRLLDITRPSGGIVTAVRNPAGTTITASWTGFRDNEASRSAGGLVAADNSAEVGESDGADGDGPGETDGADGADGDGAGVQASSQQNSPGLKYHVYITTAENGFLNVSSFVGTFDINEAVIIELNPTEIYWIHVVAEDAAGNKSDPPVKVKSDRTKTS